LDFRIIPDEFLVKPNEIHVFQWILHDSEIWLDRFLRFLNQSERDRASRFYQSIDKQRFVIARGIVRCLLSTCLHVQADKIILSSTQFGKPILGKNYVEPYKFNLSHSGNVIVIALSYGIEVGIDVEIIRTISERDSIVNRWFSTHEKQEFFGLEESIQQEAFFTAWSRKESILKTLGTGLSESPTSVSVSIIPRKPCHVIALPCNRVNLREWYVYDIPVPQGYAGALSFENSNKTAIQLWQFETTSNSEIFIHSKGMAIANKGSIQKMTANHV
jgi:4'-phosphopantetheinyl transferase